MPALHPCPRCKRMIPVGVQYCPDCRPVAEAQAKAAIERRQEYKRKQAAKRYNARRDPKYQAFYLSKNWRALSRAKLQTASYRCEAKLPKCTGIACEVHHKQPIQTQEGWDRRFDWDNLEAIMGGTRANSDVAIRPASWICVRFSGSWDTPGVGQILRRRRRITVTGWGLCSKNSPRHLKGGETHGRTATTH